ncbi:MAG: glycosyltransferase family protein [Ignavibacteriales bacterium]|nr:glycosyltransferase family protein [Ignavibacteriales bacterium]
MNIVTVVQARVSSTRLPGKVLLPILGKPLLLLMIERIQKAKLIGNLVIATSTNIEDDSIENLCKENSIECFRGHLTDLLDRHYQVAKKFNADAIVKIPSDCPLIDPSIIDRVLKFYIDNEEYDYVSNLHPATYPDGNDVEIFSFQALEHAWRDASKPYEREHTTPFFWENNNVFKIGNVTWETGLDFSSSLRFTIDYKEDYEFIKKVYEELYPTNPNFSLNDILRLLDQKPEIIKINHKFAGTYWYDNHLNELKNIEEYKAKKYDERKIN